MICAFSFTLSRGSHFHRKSGTSSAVNSAVQRIRWQRILWKALRESTIRNVCNFLISWGSLAEVGYCLHVARRLRYITDATYSKLELDVRRVGLFTPSTLLLA